MPKSAAHYLKRIREMGLLGAFQRSWIRISNWLVVQVQSFWWGWQARREISDSQFLSHLDGDWHSVDELIEYFAERSAESFMLPHGSSEDTNIILKNQFSSYYSAVLSAADSICRNELNLLGQVFQFSQGINWHCDPVTGYQFPVIHRSRLNRYTDSNRPVDLIRFWELNRHQHFFTLGIAYFLTGEERYVEVFCSQIQNWIAANPLQHGVNWYYPLEVSIRIMAWTTAFQFFRGSSEFQEKIENAFLKSLWQQTNFLSHNLQNIRTKDDIPNNHILAELTGLILVGSIFPEFKDAAKWRKVGSELIKKQVVAQTHPDGVNKEQATGYHRFIAELLLLIVAKNRNGQLPREPVIEETLASMIEYMASIVTPAGSAPMWGDTDFGRALGLGLSNDFWDFRPVISAGAVLYKRKDWKFIAGRFDEEAYWLLGNQGLQTWQLLEEHPPNEISKAFPDAGMYIIRDSWKNDTDMAFFRCGPLGLGGEGHCAHSHSDLLSFILWINGEELLVDSGTYIYHDPMRDYFRISSAHNTVIVDGIEQAIPKPNFNWSHISEAKCIDWNGKSVTGVLKFPNRIEFTRQLSQIKPGKWEIKDVFRGKDSTSHNISWFFHFAPNVNLHSNTSSGVVTVYKEGKSFVEFVPPKEGIIEISNSWYSQFFGCKEPNPLIKANWEGEISSVGISFCWKFELTKEEERNHES